MNVWKPVLAALVIFLAGIITGATLFRVAQGPRWRVQRPPDNRTVGNPNDPRHQNPNASNDPRPSNFAGNQGILSREFTFVLERQLELTPEQREQIGRIMADGQQRVRELRSRIDPELKKELQQTREQIRAVLTPEQRERFEQLMKRPPRREGLDGAPRDRRPREPRDATPGEPPTGGAPPPPPER